MGGLLMCIDRYLDAGTGCWFETCWGKSRVTTYPLDLRQGSLDRGRELKRVYLLAECEQVLHGFGQRCSAGSIASDQTIEGRLRRVVAASQTRSDTLGAAQLD